MSFTRGYTVNSDTQYAFTVSNETIEEAVQAEGGITEQDIALYCYSALVDSRIKSVFIQSVKNVMESGFDSWQAENMPYYFIRDTRYVDSNDDINKDDIVYERNLLTWSGTIYPNTPLEKQGTFLIMDMVDIKRWYVDFNAGMFITDTFASEITEGGITSVFPGYNGSGYSYLSSTVNEPVIHSDNNDPLLNPDENIHIINVLVINEELWIGQLNPSDHGQAETGIFQSTYGQYVNSYVDGYLETSSTPPPIIYQRGSQAWAGIAEIIEMDYPDLGNRSTVYRSYIETSDGIIMELNGNSGSTFDVLTSSGSHCKDLHTLLTWQSWCGLKFTYDNVMYKPIIQQGVIVGYSDDMSAPSEYDQMTNVTGNNISPVPPAPVPPAPTDEDNNDPIPVAGAPYSSGLARYYVTTVASPILGHISEAMGAWNLKDSGKDLYRNIISCKLIKSPAPIPVSGSEPFTVYGVKLQYEGADITLPVVNDNPTANFGTYNIPRKFNDFRDYAPYTKVEIYLPYCGWTVLPSHVVGRSVSVRYFTDIIAATCKAVVYCGSNVIAEAAGVIGLDIPMVTENAGAKAEAVTMGLLAYGKAGLQTALGVGAAVATKGKAGVKSAVSGFENLVSAYSQTAMAFNQNYTEINGKNGDGCCIAGISAIVIKITRPKYGANTTAPYVPSEYGHATGFVSMKSAKVGSFTGLLVADNVDTSGISGATDREKQLIKLYLESGIYVNHPS